jgi:hypothetical protein
MTRRMTDQFARKDEILDVESNLDSAQQAEANEKIQSKENFLAYMRNLDIDSSQKVVVSRLLRALIVGRNADNR